MQRCTPSLQIHSHSQIELTQKQRLQLHECMTSMTTVSTRLPQHKHRNKHALSRLSNQQFRKRLASITAVKDVVLNTLQHTVQHDHPYFM